MIVTLGRPDKDRIKKEKNIKVYSYFNKKEQEEAMNRAKCIICYAGYSTMMEFCELGIKEALLLPQPTLPEQEYLADYYTKEKYFYHTILEKLDLKKDLLQIKKYHGFKVKSKTEETVKNFLMATALQPSNAMKKNGSNAINSISYEKSSKNIYRVVLMHKNSRCSKNDR